jgi:hypothetical protein
VNSEDTEDARLKGVMEGIQGFVERAVSKMDLRFLTYLTICEVHLSGNMRKEPGLGVSYM